MTAAVAIKHINLDAFIERAEARAYLWSIGELTLHEAVDVLPTQSATGWPSGLGSIEYKKFSVSVLPRIATENPMPKYKSGDQRVHYGEPADREAEQLLAEQVVAEQVVEQQAIIAPGTNGDPNDPMDDFPMVRDAGEPMKAAGQRQTAASQVVDTACQQ